ncbi:hypothetical protein AB6A40_003099 [Gnathostoma spinigerum]|uniref:Coiled-coil domain-containing protein 22 homolog n=1 Tax=Gnathostoma spinigerum TaxID=75299 RepID=A0ABD6E9R0_9BILA
MAMNVVDRLIIDTLLQLDPSFFDYLPHPPETICDLETDKVYEAIVRLVWACDPATKLYIISSKLPNNMTGRFRCACSAVNAIKILGVRDEIGYQTILYGKGKELRNVLIGLIEKLPKRSVVVDGSKNATERLLKLLSNSATDDEIPSILNKYLFINKNSWKAPTNCCRRLPFHGLSGNVFEALRHSDELYCHRRLLCAIIEANSLLSEAVSPSGDASLKTAALNWQNNLVMHAPRPKPPLPAKPKRAVLVKKNRQDEKEVTNVNVPEVNEYSGKLCGISEEVSYLQKAMEGVRKEISERTESIAKEELTLENMKSSSNAIDKRLWKLLEYPESVTRLMKFIDESDERMEELEREWLTARHELEEQLCGARTSYFSSNQDSSRQRLRDLNDSAAAIEKSLEKKRKDLNKLKTTAEKIEEPPLNRSAYTKHIFESVENIKRQQEGIEKVLAENLKIQKEVKSLSGKLDRTFTVVEERLYRDTQRDPSLQNAYRLLIKIHEECGWIFAAIEESGKLSREIDELDDQILIQQQKGIDASLEKMLNDWMEVKQENTQLLALIESL